MSETQITPALSGETKTMASVFVWMLNYVRSRPDDRAAIARFAERLAVDVDQDWENETTRFTFADGSVLSASGGEYSTTNQQGA